MQGDMSFMKYMVYLENLCYYVKFELPEDEALHSSTPAQSEFFGKKDKEFSDFTKKIC